MYNMKRLRQIEIVFISILLILNIQLVILVGTYFGIFVTGFLVGILIEKIFNYSLEGSKDNLINTSLRLNKKVLDILENRKVLDILEKTTKTSKKNGKRK